MRRILAIAAVLLAILLAWQTAATPNATPNAAPDTAASHDLSPPEPPAAIVAARRTDAPAQDGTDAPTEGVASPTAGSETEPTTPTRFTGIVRAPNGIPVAGAQISVARPEPSEHNLYGFALGKTDREGRFDVTFAHDLRAGSALVATHDDHPPLHAFVDVLPRRNDLELTFADGITFTGTAYDQSGAPLAAQRLKVVSHTNAVLPEWTPDMIPLGVNGTIGSKECQITTDGDGRFRCTAWPAGVPARIFVVGSERWRVRGVRASPNGRTLEPNICVVVVRPGLDIVLEVTTERTALVSVTIDAAAIPAAERKSLRVTADYGDGGGTLLAFDWTKRDRPTARFSCLRRSDTRALYPFEIVVGLREGHEQRFGPFTVTADTILPTLVLRRP